VLVEFGRDLKIESVGTASRQEWLLAALLPEPFDGGSLGIG
jgi:hypothetical protein